MDWQSLPFLELFLGFRTAIFLLNLYIDLRQREALQQRYPPAQVAGTRLADLGLYAKTRAYSLDKWYFNVYRSAYDLAEVWAVCVFGVLPYVWALSGGVLEGLPPSLQDWLVAGSPVRAELLQSVLFVLIYSYASTLISLPWSVYSTFVIEQKHGFNQMTPRLFARDTVMSVILTTVFTPPIVMGISYLIIRGGSWLPVYLWAFMFALVLIFMTIYPNLIQPLFNKTEPLEDGSLKSKIEALAAYLGFPLKKLFKIDGSKRSAHSNAYMYGFFSNKRIVLFDTLIKSCTEEEIVGVLAHELGHWKLRHTLYNLLGMQVFIFAQFALFAAIRTTPNMFTSFGFGGALGQPALISLMLFSMLASPMDEVLALGMSILSRANEYAADAFAVGLGYGDELRNALIRLSSENKGTLHVDSWYSTVHYTHPPLIQRLSAIDTAMQEPKKKL